MLIMFVVSFYLYSLAMKDSCSLLTVEWKASDNRTISADDEFCSRL